MINVTKTFLPPLEEYTAILKRAWDKGWITNNGELLRELEIKLKDYLGVKHLLICTNGTVVLQMALKALGITKEVITTPFSYVATTSAILWEGCQPVFVDIDPNTLCIDPLKIEAAITADTEAILATHVYGLPCNFEAIDTIAQKHRLKVIYDGAHAFGSRYGNRSLLACGDITTCSFHATKLFQMGEGGCIICNDDDLANQLKLYRQFGHVYDEHYSIGINGKNSELHAAMGLAVLPYFDSIIRTRAHVFSKYMSYLDTSDFGLSVLNNKNFCWNQAYLPLISQTKQVSLKIESALNEKGYYPRRYFFPSLNKLPYLVKTNDCGISESISERVICLPVSHDLEDASIRQICDIVKSVK